MEEDEPLPDNLQCNRTDGRQWRCKRRVKDNLKLCEIHYPQGCHRQYMEKVPESLKLQRKPKSAEEGEVNGDNIRIRATKSGVVAKIMKWKRPGETLKKMKKLKRGETQLELIRMVLQREAEKSKNKKKILFWRRLVKDSSPKTFLMAEWQFLRRFRPRSISFPAM